MIDPSTINLLDLPSVGLSDRSQLPNIPCIYFAIDSHGTIQYIGKAVDAQKRWRHHHWQQYLEAMVGVRIAYLTVNEPTLLQKVETALIQYFRPSLNQLASGAFPSQKIAGTCLSIRLATLRIERGLSLNDLSRMTALSSQYLSKIENGKSNPTLKTIGNICQGLQIQPGDWIVYDFVSIK